MLSMVEAARERSRLRDMRLQNMMTLEDHLQIVREYAPEFILPLTDPHAMASFQACIDGGGPGFWIGMGLRFCDVVNANIKAGKGLHRARRSFSGRHMSSLNLTPP